MRGVYHGIAMVLALFLAAGGAHAQQRGNAAENPFGDANRIQGWIGTYRDDPKPEMVPVLVKEMARQGLLREQDRAGIYIGFVAGVIADNQVDADKLITEMFPMPPEAQVLVIKAIAYSGLPDWKERLSRFVERMPARQILIRKFLYGKQPTLAEQPFDKGPEVLDTWWGYYFATGSYEPVQRIMTILEWSEEKNNVERLTVGAMAKWTLATHAANNKYLLDYCRAEAGRQGKTTARILNEVVLAAETFETGKIRKDAVAAIEELKVKGQADRRKWAWWGQAGQMALSVGCVAAAATGQVQLGLPCIIGGAASSAALKLWESNAR